MKNFRGRRALLSVLTVLALISLATVAIARPDTLNRDEIPNEYKWDLSDIYPDWETWEADLTRIEALMDEYTGLQGTLDQGSDQILKASRMGDDLGKLAVKLYRYAALQNVVDMTNNDIAGRLQQVRIIFARFGTAMAWFNPEMLQIPWETMEGWLDENPGLEPYRFGISDLYRQQQHVLSEEQEQLLSYFSTALSAPGQIFNELSTSDIEYEDATLADGEAHIMTPGEYYNILSTNRNQEDRRKAFEAFYGVYNAKANTYAAIYNGILQNQWATTQARNYDSCLESVLDGNNIPTEVYENLVQMVRDGADPVHRYIALRKKALELEEYHGYDGSVPLVDFDKKYPWEEVRDQIVESVGPLGSDYQDMMREAFEGGWVDVFENEGKRPGAFSAGVYGVHPYMLLNYNETLDSFFTAAHEMGHTLHTMLADQNQPYSTSDYTLFVAEVASTLNERLLLDQQLAASDDPMEKIALLTHTIDDIIGTFYSQVMFADYELQAYQLVEEGKPVTADALTAIYTKLWKDQHGDAATFDDLYGGTWTRISHFYTVPFYVYQYATCYASSAQIYSRITDASEDVRVKAVRDYLDLLKSGGNDFPMEQLKKAGVDLTKPDAFQAVIDNLGGLVTRLEEVLEAVN